MKIKMLNMIHSNQR